MIAEGNLRIAYAVTGVLRSKDDVNDAPCPLCAKGRELRVIADAIADRDGKRAEKLVSDHLLRTLATINIWR